MRVERGASQILFGLLPNQTVDLEGGVWQIERWVDPVPISIDQETLRQSLLHAVSPWSDDRDGGLSADLHSRAQVRVLGVNEYRGVLVEQFPKQWRCRRCNRIETSAGRNCRCGVKNFAQMQFVAYHRCGRLREPRILRCATHREVAVRLPGTATSRELYFYCPRCNRQLSRGFPYQICECGAGEGMTLNVHRSGSVFTPHYTVLVNPPDPAEAAKLRASGGGARALDWVLDDLTGTGPGEGKQTVQGLEDMLIQQGLDPEFARATAVQALERGSVESGSTDTAMDLPAEVRVQAQEEAIRLMTALERGRIRVQDMVDGSEPPLRTLYNTDYPDKMLRAGLSNVELLTDFPVTTLAFGFSRQEGEPSESVLVPFRERGVIQTYGLQAHTEAVLFQLNAVRVTEYLRQLGYDLPDSRDARTARIELLKAVDIPRPGQQDPQELGVAVATLLHSYAHRLIRSLASTAGIERDGLSEYLLPHHLSIIVYAASSGDFVLGGLQSVFETALHTTLEKLIYSEMRCPLDPGCRSGGGACMACLHLGEPSCRWFNMFLDRKVLFGADGFISMVSK